MSRKLVLTTFFVTILIGALGLSFEVQRAEASGTIYIRADGSIDPPTAPISTVDNVTYTFTGNINDSIVVERDNIVVDGAGCTVQGTGALDSKGMDLSERTNVTVRNTQIKKFYDGIHLTSSSNNSMNGNSITNNSYGIVCIFMSSNNNMGGNSITANDGCGILLYHSSNNDISGNNITNNGGGIRLGYSSNNVISGNTITNNSYYCIELDASLNNTVCHNNFISNTFQVNNHTPDYANSWDNGREGNYWSDYDGTDANHDGIGDTPYIIDANNTDNCPLMTQYIIPEFPSLLILPLIFTATLLAVTIYRRKQNK